MNDSGTNDTEVKNTKLNDIDVDVSIKKIKDKYEFAVDIEAKTELADAVFTFIIRRDSGEWVYRYASDDNNAKPITINKNSEYKLKLTLDNVFADGVYYVSVAAKKSDRTETYVALDDIAKFEVVNKKDSIYWQIPTTVESKVM